MKLSSWKRTALLVVLFCFLGALLWSGYKWHIKNQNDDERVMQRLSKIIVLPEEIPTIATVTNKEELANQPFFAKAENGDKIIIYLQARRAYLYRPQENKIIDMTVVTQEDQTVDSGDSPGPIPVFETTSDKKRRSTP